MRRRRSKAVKTTVNRRFLCGAVIILAFYIATINCALGLDGIDSSESFSKTAGEEEFAESSELDNLVRQSEPSDLQGENGVLSEQLWADAITDVDDPPRPTDTTPEYISLDVRDADLLDVLSMLALKLDGNVIFLEETSEITIKTERLSPITTFQTVLQKKGLDYLTLGRNYIVGQRDRLYEDFANRMYLARYGLHYVSSEAMEGYLGELGIPVESLTADPNQRALWMQGTPMALGKAREAISAMDIKENAAFGEGGSRKIRMPVATATGNRAGEELEALIDLLSILLDGFRDGRSDLGWATWDHPDPVPSIYMDWDDPVIKPYDIKMKITRDFAGEPQNQIRYLIAEGNPDNIELVSLMIAEIAGTPTTPISFEPEEVPEDLPEDIIEEFFNNQGNENSNTNNHNTSDQGGASPAGSTSSYNVAVSGVPPEGGTLSGGGTYSEGTTVTITAAPHEGFEFVRWIENGSALSNSKTYTFKIYGDRVFEAVFSRTNENDNDEIKEDGLTEEEDETTEDGETGNGQ